MGNEITDLYDELNTTVSWWANANHWLLVIAILLLALASINHYVRKKDNLYLVSAVAFAVGLLGSIYVDIYGYLIEYEFTNISFHFILSTWITVTGVSIGALCHFLISIRK